MLVTSAKIALIDGIDIPLGDPMLVSYQLRRLAATAALTYLSRLSRGDLLVLATNRFLDETRQGSVNLLLSPVAKKGMTARSYGHRGTASQPNAEAVLVMQLPPRHHLMERSHRSAMRATTSSSVISTATIG